MIGAIYAQRRAHAMGWYRKAFRLGPLRLNLSKRGVGASVGVKGARLGVDATGKPYVAGGRYGLYFRQRLGGQQQQHHVEPMATVSSEPRLAPSAPVMSEPASTWRSDVAIILLMLALLVGVAVA